MRRKILIGLGALLSNLVIAQTTTPSPLAINPRAVTIINLKQLSKEAVAPTVARWNTKGYTLIGVLYVAGAVATMRANGEELDAAFKDYLVKNPQAQSLDQIFNSELVSSLNKLQLSPTDIEVVFEDKEAIIDPSKANGSLVFSINKLESGFVAVADDKPYKPIVSVSFSQLDGAVDRQKPKAMAVNMTLPAAEQVQYDNFDLLLADAPNAYIALQKITMSAAKQSALAIKGAVIKSQKTAEPNLNPT